MLLCYTVIVMRVLMIRGDFSSQTLRVVGALAGLFLWFQMIFWLRLFDSTAQYVSLLLRTIRSISSFMILMMMIMLAFATALFMLSLNRIYNGAMEDDLIFRY